jgi:hypothetical protein
MLLAQTSAEKRQYVHLLLNKNGSWDTNQGIGLTEDELILAYHFL